MTKKLLKKQLSEFTIPFLKFKGTFAEYCSKYGFGACASSRLGGAIKAELYMVDLLLDGNKAERLDTVPCNGIASPSIGYRDKKNYLNRIEKALDKLP